MKFGLVFGHAASNLGDLAINTGAIRLLREIAPQASIHVVFLSPSPAYLPAALASLGDSGITHSAFSPASAEQPGSDAEDRAIARILWAPDEFLAETGLDDCDVLFYNSGEHLFANDGDENLPDLLWRCAALYAAKACSKRFVMLPSTFGPLHGGRGKNLLRQFMLAVDGAAGREPVSAESMNEIAGKLVHDEWLLDPAFFIAPAARPSRKPSGPARRLGLVLRLEDHGLRFGKQASAKAMALHRKTTFADSRAYQLAIAVASRHLASHPDATVEVFIQTLADRDVAGAIAATIAGQTGAGRVRTYQPASVEDYLKRLADMDFIVSSRFHGCILSILGGTPAFGVYTRAHGHKLPSLYSALGFGKHCACMDDDSPEAIASAIEASIADMRAVMPGVLDVVATKQPATVSWLRQQLRVRQRGGKKGPSGLRHAIGDGLGVLAASASRDALESGRKAVDAERQAGKSAMEEFLRMHAELLTQVSADREQQSSALRKLDVFVGDANRTAAALADKREAIGRLEAEVDALRDRCATADSDRNALQAAMEARSVALESAVREAAKLREDIVRLNGELALRDERVTLAHGEVEAVRQWHAQETEVIRQRYAQEAEVILQRHAQEVEVILQRHAQEAEAIRQQYRQETEAIQKRHARETTALHQDVKAMKELLGRIQNDRALDKKHLDELKKAEGALRISEGALERSEAELSQARQQNYEMRASLMEFNRHEAASREMLREIEYLLAGRTNELHVATHALEELRNSVRFKIGSAIADARARPMALLKLPFAILRIIRDTKSYPGLDQVLPIAAGIEAPAVAAPAGDLAATTPNADVETQASADTAHGGDDVVRFSLPADKSVLTQQLKQQLDAAIGDAWERGQANGVIDFCLDASGGARPEVQGYCLARGAGFLGKHGALREEMKLAELASKAHANPMTIAAHLCAAYHLCDYALAMRLVESLKECEGGLSRYQKQLIDEVTGYATLVEDAGRDPGAKRDDAVTRRSVYFLHSSLPHLSGGYALRAHGLIGGTVAAGWDVRAYTRPGFPGDTGKEQFEEVDLVDGIAYHRTSSPVARKDGEHKYMRACVPVFESILAKERPEVVHGRSTYLISLPALIAARRAGLPFVYEVSGLWEIVHESREDSALNRRRTERMRFLETVVARLADRVITLTEPMREELIARGVDASKIVLVPNSVDPQRYLPAPRDQVLGDSLAIPKGVPVIGYIGSFIDYEGLDDLVLAACGIAERGIDFRLLLVGDGAEFGKLKELVDSSPIREKVIMTGRVAHDAVPGYYSLIDICPFPRKPWEVCEVVSPMKPFEPMAMGKTVVVSGTRALRDIVDDGVTGLVFEKGSIDALVECLVRLVEDPALRARLGASAMAWVKRERSWESMGHRVVEQYLSAGRTE